MIRQSHYQQTSLQRIVRAEESVLGVSLNVQAQAPDIPDGNEDGKATRFRRSPDSTETLNDLPPASGSSPRRPTSVPSTYFGDTLTKLLGKWFGQFIPLGIRHTFSLGTNDIPLLQAPRLSHTLGAPGPKLQAAPQLFARAAEAALGCFFQHEVPGARHPWYFLPSSCDLGLPFDWIH